MYLSNHLYLITREEWNKINANPRYKLIDFGEDWICLYLTPDQLFELWCLGIKPEKQWNPGYVRTTG